METTDTQQTASAQPENSAKTYNGWSNFETWLVKLWIDNEEGSQNFWIDRTREIFDSALPDKTFSQSERAALDLMDALKDEHEQIAEQTGVPTTGFVADLFNAAMSEVNWHEIAVSLIETVEANETEGQMSAEDERATCEWFDSLPKPPEPLPFWMQPVPKQLTDRHPFE